MIRAMVLNSQDNVATILGDGHEGEAITLYGSRTGTVTLKQDVPFGHKFALGSLSEGQDVVKYGQVIGRTTAAIPEGMHVHVHNVESLRGRGDLASAK